MFTLFVRKCLHISIERRKCKKLKNWKFWLNLQIADNFDQTRRCPLFRGLTIIAFGKTELTNVTHDLYTRLTATFQRFFNSFSLFYVYLSHRFLFHYLISNSHTQRNSTSINKLYRMSYTLSFCNVMYYIVSEVHIGCFLEDCFYCYSQQIISAITITFSYFP